MWDASLLYGYAAKTGSQWTLTFSLHNHVNETFYIIMANYTEFEVYLQDEHFETIASKIGAFLICLTPVERDLFFNNNTKRYVVAGA